MSSELHGSSADRPDRGQADRFSEGDRPFDRVPRDVNAVPASAGWKPGNGFSRADYYKTDTDTPAEPGDADADAGSRDTGTGSPDASPDTRAGDLAPGAVEDLDGTYPEGPRSADSAAEVREAPAETAEAGDGLPPPRGPDSWGDLPREPAETGIKPDPDGDRPGDDGTLDRLDKMFGRDGAIDTGASDGAVDDSGEGDRGDAGRKPRTDTAEQPRRTEATEADNAGERADGSAEEKQSSDRPAENDQDGEQTREQIRPAQETGHEAAPDEGTDQRLDDPRMAVMEQQMDRMLAAVETMQAKLEASEEKHEAREDELQQEIGDLRTENKELRDEVAELRAEAVTDRRERPDAPDTGEQPEPEGIPDITEQERLGLRGTDDNTSEVAEQAEAAAIDQREDDEPGKEANRAVEYPKRSGYSQESMDFWKSVAGVAGAAGFSVPGMDLVTGGNATRQALEKMSPDEQIGAMQTGGAFISAAAGMTPGTALAFLGMSVAAPVLHGKLLDAVHKIRRKD